MADVAESVPIDRPTDVIWDAIARFDAISGPPKGGRCPPDRADVFGTVVIR